MKHKQQLCEFECYLLTQKCGKEPKMRSVRGLYSDGLKLQIN